MCIGLRDSLTMCETLEGEWCSDLNSLIVCLVLLLIISCTFTSARYNCCMLHVRFSSQYSDKVIIECCQLDHNHHWLQQHRSLIQTMFQDSQAIIVSGLLQVYKEATTQQFYMLTLSMQALLSWWHQGALELWRLYTSL